MSLEENMKKTVEKWSLLFLHHPENRVCDCVVIIRLSAMLWHPLQNPYQILKTIFKYSKSSTFYGGSEYVRIIVVKWIKLTNSEEQLLYLVLGYAPHVVPSPVRVSQDEIKFCKKIITVGKRSIFVDQVSNIPFQLWCPSKNHIYEF